jgi:CHAD domain-containing protein
MRRILAQLLEGVRVNIDGVLEDLDPEPLHDLRVATRRTRSALSTCKSVLPDVVVAEFALGFKWLGRMTGPCRDLDVHLIEMEVFQKRLEISDGSLDPLRQILEELRREEHLRVCESLVSERFRRLIEKWDEVLRTGVIGEPEPRNARQPVIDLAGGKIHKAYRRLVQRISTLADDAPEEAFHRLRIDAKKLRYLLEFFSGLYPEETVRSLVKDLKRLQDILGGFNDMVVQRGRNAALAEQLTASGEASSDTPISIDRLARAMAERQDEHRRALADRLGSFASANNQLLYRKTFNRSSSRR